MSRNVWTLTVVGLNLALVVVLMNTDHGSLARWVACLAIFSGWVFLLVQMFRTRNRKS